MSDQRTADDPIAERIAHWRDTFTGRRTVPWEMLNEAERIIRAAVAYHEQAAAGEIARLVAAHEAELQRLQDQLDRARKNRDEWHEHFDRANKALEAKRTLQEQRSKTGEEVQVQIGRSQGAWRVADLEEVAYRLRCGGAVDETQVSVSDWTMKALVPAPNLVPLVRPDAGRAVRLAEERPAPLPDPVVPEGEMSRWWLAVTLVAFVVGVAVTAIGVVVA